MSDSNALTRSELARLSGIGIETVRFYEGKGLLMPSFRDSSNYRRYGKEAVARARIIRSAKELGFSLEEVSDLLDLRDLEENPCPQARAKARAKIKLIDAKIKELRKLKRGIGSLIDQCLAEEPEGHCAIFERLESGGTTKPPQGRNPGGR